LAQINNGKPLNNKLRKLEFMLQIRRMVVEGSSYNEIQSKLGLSRRTFYRYLNAIFDKDRQVLRKVNEDEVMTQAAILRDRYNDIYQTLDAISKDNTIAADQRINACGARAELSRSIAKIYTEAPAFVAMQNKKMEEQTARQKLEQEILAVNNRREEREAQERKYYEYQRNVDSTEQDQEDSDEAEP
jgi:ACT domain-containing protein